MSTKRILLAIPVIAALCSYVMWMAADVVVGVPAPFDITVENGTLHTLDFDNGTSTVIYNLSAVFRFRNPSVIGTGVSWLTAAPSYGGHKLGPDIDLPSFKLRRKKTTMVPLDVQGRQIIDAELAATVGRTYAEDAGRGYYVIEAKLKMEEPKLKMDYSGALSDSSCTLYFPAPADPRGVINLFDGDECRSKGKISVRN